MPEAFIVDAVRSPIGRRNGALSSIRGDELAAQVLNGLVERNSLDPGEVEDVQLGCVTQIGEQGWNLGRMVPLVAGWPETVAGTTVPGRRARRSAAAATDVPPADAPTVHRQEMTRGLGVCPALWPAAPSTGSAAPRCRRTSTPPRRSGPGSST
jgi:acetyl-CoA acyltransferase